MKYQKGIGLIEVIFTLGISVIIVTSLVSLTLYTLRSSLNSKLMLRANNLATGQLELVRAYRDSMGENWAGFVDSVDDCTGSTYCTITTGGSLAVLGSASPATDGTGPEAVAYYFQATPIDSDVMRISVVATWGDGLAVRNYTDLSSWRAQ